MCSRKCTEVTPGFSERREGEGRRRSRGWWSMVSRGLGKAQTGRACLPADRDGFLRPRRIALCVGVTRRNSQKAPLARSRLL